MERNRREGEGLSRAIIGFVIMLGVLVAIGLAALGPDSHERVAEAPELVGGTGDARAGDEGVATGPNDGATVVDSAPIEGPVPESNLEIAIVVDEEAPDQTPAKPVTYAEAEEAYFAARYDEAADLFTAYTERKSENAWGFFMLGLSLHKCGELDDAETALRGALEIDADHGKSRINLARVLLDLQRPEDALGEAEAVVDADPANGNAYRTLGRAYHTLGLIDEAEIAYAEAIRKNGEDTWSLNNLGLLWIERGRHDEAIGPLARAVTLDGERALFRNNLGAALERTGHFALAAESYRRAVEIDDSHEKAAVSLARVEELREKDDLPDIDLAALAAGWSVDGEEKEIARSDP